jgi:dolichol-phosphate mannosyltransferase
LYYYNIHNIVKVKSEVSLYELEYFASNDFADSDIVINVKDSITSGIHFKRTLIPDPHKDYYKVKYSEHFGRLGAQFSIEFSDKVNITINKLITASRHVIYVNLVEPILRFLLISKGFVLLHSACLDIKGHGILFSAPPDTGKTTTVLKCIKNGFSFLSDDMTIVCLPNEAICFPKPMTISAHTYKTATTVADNDHDKIEYKLRSLIHSKTGRQFMHKLANYNVPIFTINTIGQAIIKPPKFKIENLLQSVTIQEKTRVKTLYFLERGADEKTEEVPTTVALRKAIENSDDAFLFPPYADLIHHINIGGKTAKELLQEERDILEKFLTRVNCRIIKSDKRAWYQMVIESAQLKVNK